MACARSLSVKTVQYMYFFCVCVVYCVLLMLCAVDFVRARARSSRAHGLPAKAAGAISVDAVRLCVRKGAAYDGSG